MGNVHMEAAQINYRGGEKKMSVEEALKNTSGEAAAIAQLQGDVSDLNSNKANKADIATEFSDLTNYNAGDLVYYEGDLYEFQVDHAAGDWETSEVIQKDLSDIVTTLKSGLTNKAHVPSTSDTSLGTVTAGNTDLFTATDDGYMSIYCVSGSSQKTFSAVIRDSSVLRYGTFVTATLPAYNSDAIGGLFVKKGRTYSVRNVGEYDINVYFCS